MEGLQFDNEELRHETEFLRNKVAMFYNEARMREDEGGHGGGEGFSREEMPPPSSVRFVFCACIRLFGTEHPFRDSAPFLEPFPEPVRALPRRDASVQLSEVCFFLHPYITVDLPRTAPSIPLGHHAVPRIVFLEPSHH